MKIRPTELPGVLVVEPDVFNDRRGFFLETYHEKKYRDGGIKPLFLQDNHSRSMRGTLRGLHAQRVFQQAKLVRVVRGEVFDVAVDIRRGSPTFGRWLGTTLSEENFRQVFIPEGFAHGFCVVSEVAEVEYKCSDVYHPGDEFSVLWNDPAIGIKWPVSDPILSEKDRAARPLSDLADSLPRRGASGA